MNGLSAVGKLVVRDNQLVSVSDLAYNSFSRSLTHLKRVPYFSKTKKLPLNSRYMPGNEIVSVKQPRLVSERVALARKFVDTFELGPEMQVFADDPNGNAFQSAYAPWPIRIYVIEDGKMQYISAPENCTHDVTELRDWLAQRRNKK